MQGLAPDIQDSKKNIVQPSDDSEIQQELQFFELHAEVVDPLAFTPEMRRLGKIEFKDWHKNTEPGPNTIITGEDATPGYIRHRADMLQEQEPKRIEVIAKRKRADRERKEHAALKNKQRALDFFGFGEQFDSWMQNPFIIKSKRQAKKQSKEHSKERRCVLRKFPSRETRDKYALLSRGVLHRIRLESAVRNNNDQHGDCEGPKPLESAIGNNNNQRGDCGGNKPLESAIGNKEYLHGDCGGNKLIKMTFLLFCWVITACQILAFHFLVHPPLMLMHFIQSAIALLFVTTKRIFATCKGFFMSNRKDASVDFHGNVSHARSEEAVVMDAKMLQVIVHVTYESRNIAKLLLTVDSELTCTDILSLLELPNRKSLNTAFVFKGRFISPNSSLAELEVQVKDELYIFCLERGGTKNGSFKLFDRPYHTFLDSVDKRLVSEFLFFLKMFDVPCTNTFSLTSAGIQMCWTEKGQRNCVYGFQDVLISTNSPIPKSPAKLLMKSF